MLARPAPPSGAGSQGGGPGLPRTGDPWQLLLDPAAPPDAAYAAWLGVQCSLLPGAACGLLMLTGPDGALLPAAVWGEASQREVLSALAARAFTEPGTAVGWHRPEGTSRRASRLHLAVAKALGPAEAPYGIVAVCLVVREDEGGPDPEGVARQLQMGSGWLLAYGSRRRSVAADAELAQARLRAQRSAAAMDTLAVVGEHPDLAASAIAIVNELTASLRCSRVSLGLVRRGRMRVQAMSHMATVRRGGLADLLESAMEEGRVHGGSICFPSVPEVDDGRAIVLSHRRLAQATGTGAQLMTVPLPGGRDGLVGALVLEREAGPAFDADTLARAEAIAALAGPMLVLQLRADRWVAGRTVDAAASGLRAVTGPRRPALKLGAACVVLAAAVMACLTGTHRVASRALIEGEVQRAAVAPFDGFIAQAPARAGDRVRAGDLLAAMDERDLELERVKAVAETEKLTQRQQEAVSKHDRASTAVLAAQVAQAQAAQALAQDRLARARIVSGLDGIVVSGDLSQMLGSPVERGHLLFEIAPLDRFRLAILVNEEGVRWVTPGQKGTLRLASLPGRLLRFTVVGRTPVASVEDGHNVFRVEASLDDLPEALLPGMEGVAKIEVGARNLLWVWLHPLFDTVRLAVWKWTP